MEKPSRLKAPSADTGVAALRRAWSDGDQDALQALTPIVYEVLHRLARRVMRRERSGHSLQATAVEEIGEVLKVSTDTIKRDWRAAKAWLYQELAR